MKSTRQARRARPVLGRVTGYGGAALLVAAAVVVLLIPLIDKNKGGAGAAGASGPAGQGATPGAGQTVPPGVSAPHPTPSNPASQQNRTGRLYPGGGRDGGWQGGWQGGGPQMPGQYGSGTGLSWCPQGTAYYRATGGSVDVVITVSASGAIRAELSLQGYAPQSQQTTVRGGKPHTFHFKGVPAQLVQWVKVTTVSVGVAVQSCYARAA